MNRAAAGLAFLLALPAGGVVADDEVSVRGTLSNTSEYVGDNGPGSESLYGDDDDFWVFQSSALLQASSRPFDGAVRLDSTLFHTPPQKVNAAEFSWGPGSADYTLLNYGNDFRVERVHGTVKVGGFKLTGGDFYVTFGRGMVLSLTKQDGMNLDNSLRGGRVDYASSGSFKAVAVGGVVNMLNIDPLTHQILEDDPMDRIVGARLEWDPVDALGLGVHGVYMWPRFTEESQVAFDRMFVDQGTGIETFNTGLNTEVSAGDFNIYLEANGQVHDNYRPPEGTEDVEDEMGWAAFGEVSYDFTATSIKAQGFYYRHWLMEGALRGSATDVTAAQPITYHSRVSLEPTWVPQKSFGNSAGGKLTGDLYVEGSNTQLTLDNAVVKYLGGLVPQGQWIETDDTLLVHPILTVRQEFGKTGIRLTVGGGHLWELELDDERRRGRLWHLLADLGLPVSGPHGIQLRGELRRHGLEISEGGVPYWVTLVKAGYDWSGLFGLSAIYEYSDQTEGIQAKIGSWTLPIRRQHYLQAMAVFYPPKPLDGLSFGLTGGSQRGGKKCTGGGCREYPDAVGVKLETVYRF